MSFWCLLGAKIQDTGSALIGKILLKRTNLRLRTMLSFRTEGVFESFSVTESNAFR